MIAFAKLTGNLDLLVVGSVTQMSETQDSVVVLLLPLLGVSRQGLLVLLLLAESWVRVAVGLLRLLLGSRGRTSRRGSLIVLGERALEEGAAGSINE